MEVRELRSTLCQLYDTPTDARRLARDAGLEISRIDFTGAATSYWDSVLWEAIDSGKINVLLGCARQEYPARFPSDMSTVPPSGRDRAQPGGSTHGVLVVAALGGAMWGSRLWIWRDAWRVLLSVALLFAYLLYEYARWRKRLLTVTAVGALSGAASNAHSKTMSFTIRRLLAGCGGSLAAALLFNVTLPAGPPRATRSQQQRERGPATSGETPDRAGRDSSSPDDNARAAPTLALGSEDGDGSSRSDVARAGATGPPARFVGEACTPLRPSDGLCDRTDPSRQTGCFRREEIYLETHHSQCQSGVCVAYHYDELADLNGDEHARRVNCVCRCAMPEGFRNQVDPATLCACPEGFACVANFAGPQYSQDVAGSYCIRRDILSSVALDTRVTSHEYAPSVLPNCATAPVLLAPEDGASLFHGGDATFSWSGPPCRRELVARWCCHSGDCALHSWDTDRDCPLAFNIVGVTENSVSVHLPTQRGTFRWVVRPEGRDDLAPTYARATIR